MAQPLIIAHRGASAHAPENTLSAFALAIENGADGIEFDVWRCGSGEIVVTHDEELTRLTGSGGKIGELTLGQLKERDFGLFKAPRFAGERIPTLEEVLDLAKDLKMINIEIKGTQLRSSGIELPLLKTLLSAGLLDKVLVSSFNPSILYRLKKMEPRLRLGLLCYRRTALPLRQAWPAAWIKPYSLNLDVHLLHAGLMRKVRQKNYKVIAWTVNDAEQLKRCLKMEVDGIITDDPAWALSELALPEAANPETDEA